MFAAAKKGFTLIEVMIVIVIIAIITAILMPHYDQAIEKTKVSEALLVTRAIADANRMYNLKNGDYTDDMDNLDIQIPGKEGFLDDKNKESRLFSYTAGNGGEQESIATADRLPADTFYTLIIYNKRNGVGCKYFSEKGKKFCASLGEDYYVIN